MVPATPTQNALEIERVLVQGDIGKMPPEMRLEYYRTTCESLGLNPLTKPFEYLTLQGKTILYAKKDATDQLRKIHGVSINIVSREVLEGVYIVTARGTDKHGRQDESIGALPLPASPVERANAIMKCETKAKRRVTLSICGLGMLDETELETIGSKEAQAEYLRSKGIEPAAPKPKYDFQGNVIPDVRTASEQHKALIVETAKMLDEPPASTKTVEIRQSAKDKEAQAILDEAQRDQDTKAGRSGAHGCIPLEKLKNWKKLKDEIRSYTGTDEIYKSTLKAKGYEHANEIQTQKEATSIWTVLGNERNRLKQEKELLGLLEHGSEVLGARVFADLLGCFGALTIPDVLAMTGDELAHLLESLKDAVDAKNGGAA